MIIFNPEAKLPNTSGLNFFILYKNLSKGQWIPVYKSEIKKAAGTGVFKWN